MLSFIIDCAIVVGIKFIKKNQDQYGMMQEPSKREIQQYIEKFDKYKELKYHAKSSEMFCTSARYSYIVPKENRYLYSVGQV